MIFASFVFGVIVGVFVVVIAMIIIGNILQECEPKVKNIRTMKHHERASLIKHGWMTSDGKWTNKGMPDS